MDNTNLEQLYSWNVCKSQIISKMTNLTCGSDTKNQYVYEENWMTLKKQ